MSVLTAPAHCVESIHVQVDVDWNILNRIKQPVVQAASGFQHIQIGGQPFHGQIGNGLLTLRTGST